MKINDKVYVVRKNGKVYQGIIVAKGMDFENVLPQHGYVVKKVTSAEGVVSAITAAFYGSADELEFCRGRELVAMPITDESQKV